MIVLAFQLLSRIAWLAPQPFTLLQIPRYTSSEALERYLLIFVVVKLPSRSTTVCDP